MAIQSVQLNNAQADSQNTRVVKPYREAEGPVKTKKKVHPLPPKGHLVDDNLATGTKYFFKDIGYDMKSVKNGVNGTANDHQLGRLNDVGLRLGGIGIATYLASITTNPKARLMEYIGLATFLTSMSLYPKIAVNAPARILHGYDIDKQYIDDKGRKKSVQQDSNYVPYDMYNGANKGEDLDAIGDKMGIPKDIKNRHDVIREQMRKIATQNNTLWMLTAGFATPLMTALLCSGIEKYIVEPGLEKTRNAKYNSEIQSMLKEATEMGTEVGNIKNSLGESVNSILSKYEGKTLPQEEVENIIELLTKDSDSMLATSIKSDITKILSESKVVTIDSKNLKSLMETAGNSITGRDKKFIIENVLPSQEGIEELIKTIKPDCDLSKGVEFTEEEFKNLRVSIFNKAVENLEANPEIEADEREFFITNINKFKEAFKLESSPKLTKESIQKATNFAKILGDFRKKANILDKCENFKFEHAPETVLANYYGKFQRTLIKQLGISPKDYKRMSNDKEFAQKILNEKMTALCQNEEKYRKTFEKLGKILEDMDKSLHGSTESSQIKDMINAIELVYGKTAERLTAAGIGEATADGLVKGTTTTIGSREELFDLLDGIAENKFKDAGSDDLEAMRYFANGKGSSKNLKISKLIDRYQGEVNSFFRIFHTLDFFKRAAKPEELAKLVAEGDSAYVERIIAKIKDVMLSGSIADYTTKLGIENKYEYRDLYNIGWATEAENYGSTKQKGIITEQTQKGLSRNGKGSKSLAERLQFYITRFKNIIANDQTYILKPNHILDETVANNYTDMARKPEAKFNLVAQNPVDMIQKAAGKMHADRMWLKSVGIMTGAVFGVTLLAQFGFGKIKNKHNLQKIDNSNDNKKKQVKNEASR